MFSWVSGGIRSCWFRVAKPTSEKRRLRWVLAGLRRYLFFFAVQSLFDSITGSSCFHRFSWISGGIRFACGHITCKSQAIPPLALSKEIEGGDIFDFFFNFFFGSWRGTPPNFHFFCCDHCFCDLCRCCEEGAKFSDGVCINDLKAYGQFVQSGDSKKHTEHQKKEKDRKSKTTESSATKHTNSNPAKTFQNPSGKLYSSASTPPSPISFPDPRT